jgi:hypothetical protein
LLRRFLGKRRAIIVQVLVRSESPHPHDDKRIDSHCKHSHSKHKGAAIDHHQAEPVAGM